MRYTYMHMLLIYVCNTCIYILYVSCIVNIVWPPENITACRNDDTTTISCGYQSNITFPVTWIINGTSFTQDQIMRMNSSYRLNDLTSPSSFSLTIFSINGTTTIQCVIQSTPNVTSTHGLINVTGMYVCMYACLYLGYIFFIHACMGNVLSVHYVSTYVYKWIC